MIHLHFKVKARAFGITFGTVEETREVTDIIALILKKWAPSFVGFNLAEVADQVQLNGMIGRDLSLDKPITLYNDRGVLIELK